MLRAECQVQKTNKGHKDSILLMTKSLPTSDLKSTATGGCDISIMI